MSELSIVKGVNALLLNNYIYCILIVLIEIIIIINLFFWNLLILNHLYSFVQLD